jgi:hypothetical protein
MALLVTLPFAYGSVWAHCDRLDGPVAKAAAGALDSGQLQSIQIWVGPHQETELREAFQQALVVRKQSPAAQKLADRYFIETAVRLHREAEGMPYTGVKPAGLPVLPDIQTAEEALDSGKLHPLTRLLQAQLEKQLSELFREAVEARQQRRSSVEAGRKWVDSYVRFIVYSYGLYEMIKAGPEHGLAD